MKYERNCLLIAAADYDGPLCFLYLTGQKCYLTEQKSNWAGHHDR